METHRKQIADLEQELERVRNQVRDLQDELAFCNASRQLLKQENTEVKLQLAEAALKIGRLQNEGKENTLITSVYTPSFFYFIHEWLHW